MILKYEVDEMISNMTASGVDPIKEDYVIYANPKVRFGEAIYQLEIIVDEKLPDGVVCLARRKTNDRVRSENVQNRVQPIQPVLPHAD